MFVPVQRGYIRPATLEADLFAVVTGRFCGSRVVSYFTDFYSSTNIFNSGRPGGSSG